MPLRPAGTSQTESSRVSSPDGSLTRRGVSRLGRSVEPTHQMLSSGDPSGLVSRRDHDMQSYQPPCIRLVASEELSAEEELVLPYKDRNPIEQDKAPIDWADDTINANPTSLGFGLASLSSGMQGYAGSGSEDEDADEDEDEEEDAAQQSASAAESHPQTQIPNHPGGSQSKQDSGGVSSMSAKSISTHVTRGTNYRWRHNRGGGRGGSRGRVRGRGRAYG